MDTLDDWLNKLKASEKHIIVEGVKDKHALVRLGIPAERISIVRGALFKFVEHISKKHRHVILLTDLDKAGKKLYKTLNSDLQGLGVRVDRRFREFLFKETKLSHIEGVNTYFQKNL